MLAKKICSVEYTLSMKIENGVNPEDYAFIKISDLKEVENLPDDDFMIVRTG